MAGMGQIREKRLNPHVISAILYLASFVWDRLVQIQMAHGHVDPGEAKRRVSIDHRLCLLEDVLETPWIMA